MTRLLVIDDEDEVRAAVARRLAREGFDVTTADGEIEGVGLIQAADRPFDLITTDMVMEDPDSGIRTLEAALSRDLFTEVIVLTAYGNVNGAVECMRRGAFDYVEKNIPGVDVYDLLVMKVNLALERRRNSQSTVKHYAEIGRRHGVTFPD